MAITYFAIVSTDPDPKCLDLPAACVAGFRAAVRLWNTATPSVASNKWLIIGDNWSTGTDARLRSVSTANRNTFLSTFNTDATRHAFAIADFGATTRKFLRHDIHVAQSLIDAL